MALDSIPQTNTSGVTGWEGLPTLSDPKTDTANTKKSFFFIDPDNYLEPSVFTRSENMSQKIWNSLLKDFNDSLFADDSSGNSETPDEN